MNKIKLSDCNINGTTVESSGDVVVFLAHIDGEEVVLYEKSGEMLEFNVEYEFTREEQLSISGLCALAIGVLGK